MVVRLTMTQLTDLGVCAKCAHEETQNLKTNQSRTPSPRYTLARGDAKADEGFSQAEGAVPCHCSSEQELKSICPTFP